MALETRESEKLMEHSNLNLSDSQIPGSSHSPLLPSEPPDIGNWFSSYVYESFVLDTNDNIGDSSYKQSKCEEDRCPIEESNSEKEKFGNFSSNGFAKCNSSIRDDKVENQRANEISGSSYSLSLPSEPPDIKNWFSSYVYESPVLDDDFGDFCHKDSRCEKDGLVIEESNRKKEENFGEFRKRDEVVVAGKILSNGFVQCKSSFRDNEQENHSLTKDSNSVEGNSDLSVWNNLGSERNSEHKLENRSLQNHDSSPTKDVKKSSLNDEVYLRKLEKTFSQRTELMSLNFNKNLGSSQKQSPGRLIDVIDFIEENPEAKGRMEGVDLVLSESKLKSTPVNATSIRKSSHESTNKENEGEEMAKNGFVSVKNRSTKTNVGNSLEWPQKASVKRLRNNGGDPSAVDNDVVKRKVLSETTNFQHSDVPVVTGKWKCPQKSKPNLGPPLKQLRLEQWVHRV